MELDPKGREWSPNFGSQGGVSSRDKTHCVNGHEFTPENTIVKTIKPRNFNWPETTKRSCRICQRASDKRHRDLKRIEKMVLELGMATEVER